MMRAFKIYSFQFSSVQLSLTRVLLFATPWTAAHQASPYFIISQGLLKLMSSYWMVPSNISSSATLFSFYLQSFPASGSFPMIRLFTSGGQSIGVSASTSVLSMNIQGCFPLGWIGSTGPQCKQSFVKIGHLDLIL